MRTDQIALQLYTVRRLMADDLAGTLRAVAAAGYESVELAGLPPIETPGLAGLLADNGLNAVASHESVEALRRDPEGIARRLAALGCPRAIVPWIPESDRRSLDDVRRFAAELGGLASRLADVGIRLGYHNHAFEFEPRDGSSIWGVLTEELPPPVEVELDLYWAAFAGRDPVAEIRAMPGRVRLLHAKDLDGGPERHDAPAGSGVLDWPGILQAGRDAAVQWYVVEQDEPADPIADITSARMFLGGLALP